MRVNTDNIAWLGHNSFRLTGSRIIYFDPWEIKGPCADIICITHDHHDHCCPQTVLQISSNKTNIFTDEHSAEKLRHAKINANITVLDPDDEVEVLGINIKTLPAYSSNSGIHPPKKKYLGFYINFDGLKIYMAGDSGHIPEMNGLKPHVAMLPVDGPDVMDADEAAIAARNIQAKHVIPMHYGKINANIDMAYKLTKLLENEIPVELKRIER